MTYGVDECRRCGNTMRVRRDSEDAGDLRPSRMPEAQWRAAGFKAQPTISQVRNPWLGCCTDCKAEMLRKRWKPGLRIGGAFAGIAILFALIWGLAVIYIP